MSEKATQKTLARTMYAVIAAIVCMSSTSYAAVAEAPTKVVKIKSVGGLSKSLVKSAQKYLPASQRPAPKGLKARGKWVKEILHEAGFRGKKLESAWAIVMKESTGWPKAYNGNRATGDSSYGLFQINMIGNLGPDRREIFGIKSNKELFDPLTNAKAAYHMSNGGKNWYSWDIDSNGYNGGQARGAYLSWIKKYPEG